MTSNNLSHELVDRRSDAERRAGVARVQSELAVPGADDCIDCGAAIGAARRRAYPAARRCVRCQSAAEDRR